MVKMQAEDF
jgi:hypothetical protein